MLVRMFRTTVSFDAGRGGEAECPPAGGTTVASTSYQRTFPAWLPIKSHSLKQAMPGFAPNAQIRTDASIGPAGAQPTPFAPRLDGAIQSPPRCSRSCQHHYSWTTPGAPARIAHASAQ